MGSGVDPWYDFLAFPIAPMILLVQFGSLFAGKRQTRWVIGGASTFALIVILVYVATLDLDDDEGANIGAGIVFLVLLASLTLLVAAAVRDAAAAVFERLRSRQRESDVHKE